MSVSSRNDGPRLGRALKLMAYADGELEGAELEEVEAWLAEDPDALRMASDVAHLGGYLKTGFEGSADAKAMASFDVADAVMAKAQEQQQAESPSVASLASARARRGGAASGASGGRAGASGGRGAYRVAGGVIAAMALAASVFMIARPHDEEPIARGRGHAPVVAPSWSAEPTALSSSGSSGGDRGTPDNGVGVDINVAETAGQSVSVVYLPSENSLTTSVVLWVDETGEKK